MHFPEQGGGLGLATGLGIEPRPVAQARQTAETQDRLPDLVCGSSLDMHACALQAVRADGSCLQLALTAVDMFYACPWPREKRDLAELVASQARAGALPVLHLGAAQWEVLRTRPRALTDPKRLPNRSRPPGTNGPAP